MSQVEEEVTDLRLRDAEVEELSSTQNALHFLQVTRVTRSHRYYPWGAKKILRIGLLVAQLYTHTHTHTRTAGYFYCLLTVSHEMLASSA